MYVVRAYFFDKRFKYVLHTVQEFNFLINTLEKCGVDYEVIRN